MPFTAILREQKIACIRLNKYRLLYLYLTQIKKKTEKIYTCVILSSERKTRKTVVFVMYLYVILLQWLIESLNLTYLLLLKLFFLQVYSAMYIGRYLFHELFHDSHLKPAGCLSVSNSNKSLNISLKELVTIVYWRHEIIFLSTSRIQNFAAIQTKNGFLLISQFEHYNDKETKV